LGEVVGKIGLAVHLHCRSQIRLHKLRSGKNINGTINRKQPAIGWLCAEGAIE
jgi:hypothetical protein